MTSAENPFRVSRVHALPFLWPTGESLETLTRRWEAQGRRGAITGPHGHGKTTLLREWKDYMQAQGWEPRLWTLTEEFPTLPRDVEEQLGAFGPRGIAVLDGAEQLGAWGWRRWQRATRGAAGHLITNHQPGRWATLFEARADPDRLTHLLQQLLDHDLSRLPASPEILFHTHSGDLRMIFRHLYEVYA